MRTAILAPVLGVALLALAAAPVGAAVLTVNSILTAQNAGAPTDGIITMINNPANTVGMSAGDLVTLRDAGVSESVIAAVWARVPPSTPGPIVPDDPRLVDLVHLVKSGISEAIVAEQVKQAGQPYDLSVNDLLYLKQNDVVESTIIALMATGAGAAPGTPVAALAPVDLTFDDLILKTSFMKKDRPGSLVLQGDTMAWTDGNDSRQNFEFKVTGLQKVWFTCQARTPENFCHQINFQIVKGGRYTFEDRNRESGSNAAVLTVMAALRTRFPEIAYGSPVD